MYLAPRDQVIAVKAAQMFDSRTGALVSNPVVLIKGDRITDVGANLAIPAGTRVSSDHKVDWYRVGYRYRIQRGDEPGAELPLEIHSRVGAAIFDFHYRLDGSNGAEADRGYVKVAPQMGLELGWHATNKLSIEGEVTSTLPFSSMPWILTTQVVGKYTLWESGRLHLDGFLGAGYQKISFKDNQDVSNDINLDFGPMLMLGLEIRF